MQRNLSADVLEAVKILESWEKSIELPERMGDFERAVEILNECMQDADQTSLRSFIINIKRTYTRKLLESLSFFPPLQMDEWFEYVKTMLLSVPDDIDVIIKEYPALKENEQNFINLWAEKAIPILREKRNKLQKNHSC
jgi:hypothetical protein